MTARMIASLIAVAAALSLAPAAQAELTSSNATELSLVEPPWLVRVIFNNGNTTSHKVCKEEDFAMVANAVIASGNVLEPERRQLRAGKQHGGRRLGHNCAHVCDGLFKTTCAAMAAGGNSCFSYAYAGNCNPVCDRNLQEEQQAAAAATKFVIIDDLLYSNGNGGRQLSADAAYGVSPERCNEAKAKLVKAALTMLDGVDPECANLVLSPLNVQCLVLTEGADID